jgi:hypothetical protein
MTYFILLTLSLACAWWGGQELEKAKAGVAVDQAKAKDAEASLLAAAAATEAAETRASELERALASERSRADSEASLKVAAEAKLAEVSPEVVELKSKVMCRVFSVFLSVCPSVFPIKSHLLSFADSAKETFFHLGLLQHQSWVTTGSNCSRSVRMNKRESMLTVRSGNHSTFRL